MAVLHVNPTRMELTRLKKRLAVATRGHKLLKDKRDELMRQFLILMQENKRLRAKVENEIESSHKHFMIARSVMSEESLTAALMMPKQVIGIEIGTKNIMSVNLPVLKPHRKSADDGDLFSYGYLDTSADLDDAVWALAGVFPFMLELAEKEKACELLSTEIEKTRRRVNALEHVLIPDLKETIKYITMKLDENERSGITRLIRIKDMMIEQRLNAEE